jgi:hypothetical protein
MVLQPSQMAPQTDTFDQDHPFFGATVVFTGTLESMVRRDAMQHVLRDATHVVLAQLDFASVQLRPELDADTSQLLPQRGRAVDRRPGPSKVARRHCCVGREQVRAATLPA